MAGVLVMQRELGVARVGVVLYLGSIDAAVIAWLVLGEALHAYHAWAMAMAMAMVLPGIYLVNRTCTSQLRECAMRRPQCVALSYRKKPIARHTVSTINSRVQSYQ